MTNPEDDTDRNAPVTTTCDSGGPVEADAGAGVSGGRWLGDESPLSAELPTDLQTGLGTVLGEPAFATLADWLAAVRVRAGDGDIGVDQLCHADATTPHVGRVDGEEYHFQCFYDAVVLSALVEEPVAITTESPEGTTVETEADGTDALNVTPATAVFSFGVADDVTPPADGDPDPADMYAAVCPYVKAFPDRAAHESWAEAVSAATAALPLDGATEVAAALVE